MNEKNKPIGRALHDFVKGGVVQLETKLYPPALLDKNKDKFDELVDKHIDKKHPIHDTLLQEHGGDIYIPPLLIALFDRVEELERKFLEEKLRNK